MRHAFLVYVHNDKKRAERLLDVLCRHFWRSSVMVFYDGSEGWFPRASIDHFTWQCDTHNGVAQVLEAITSLVDEAFTQGFDTATFLKTHSVPCDRHLFYRFLRKFSVSGKLLACAAALPQCLWPDLNSLHVRLPAALKLFPLRSKPGACNEQAAMECFEENCPGWRRDALTLWKMSLPCRSQEHLGDAERETALRLAYDLDGSWEISGYCPQTGIAQTRDENFWKRYETICQP